jgi:hypothetical protein
MTDDAAMQGLTLPSCCTAFMQVAAGRSVPPTAEATVRALVQPSDELHALPRQRKIKNPPQDPQKMLFIQLQQRQWRGAAVMQATGP